MKRVLASAADHRYGLSLINLVMAIRHRSNVFDQIVIYDLGLTRSQRLVLRKLPYIELRNVEPFVDHWAACWSWKPWIWTHTDADTLVYLDAGTTVLRPLTEILELIASIGYFIVGQGQPLRMIVPRDYCERYRLTAADLSRPTVAAGIIGFSLDSHFFKQVIIPTFDDVVAGLNLGWSKHELQHRNVGMHRIEDPSRYIRDCQLFRHDQTLLNIHLYQHLDAPHINDIDKYGGWRSAIDHPDQLIWNHRHRYLSCDIKTGHSDPMIIRALLPMLRYTPTLKRWIDKQRPFLRASTYAHKTSKIARRFSRTRFTGRI